MQDTCDNGFPYSAWSFRPINRPVSSTPGGLGLYVFKEVSVPGAAQVTTLLLIGVESPMPILQDRISFQVTHPAISVVVRVETLHGIVERCNHEAPGYRSVAARLDGASCCTTIQPACACRTVHMLDLSNCNFICLVARLCFGYRALSSWYLRRYWRRDSGLGPEKHWSQWWQPSLSTCGSMIRRVVGFSGAIVQRRNRTEMVSRTHPFGDVTPVEGFQRVLHSWVRDRIVQSFINVFN